MERSRRSVHLLVWITVFVMCICQCDSFSRREKLSPTTVKLSNKYWGNLVNRTRKTFTNVYDKRSELQSESLLTRIKNGLYPLRKTKVTSSIIPGGEVLKRPTYSSSNLIQAFKDSETVTSVDYSVAKAVAIAAAVALVVAVAVPTSIQAVENNQNEIQQNFDPDLSLFIAALFDNQTPKNDLKIPVEGSDFQDDGCGDGSVRFGDGKCYPVLKRGPCEEAHQWVTVHPTQLKGRCSPRLCGRRRVFVGKDGLCHDINDPTICRGGRRLYYSAFGDSICDCPAGEYPFPSEQDDCVPLFTQGPCPAGNIVSFDPEGKLRCAPARCRSFDGRDILSQQIVPSDNGYCYTIGSRGPCSSKFQLFGYDVFKQRATCVNVRDPSSPYFSSPQEDQELDNVYNQLYPEYDTVRVVYIQPYETDRNDTAQRRQDINTFGLFQLPSSLPDPLLHSCRPGARRGINFKCTNPFVSKGKTRELLQAVRSAFRCQSNAATLQATGQCGNDSRTASCGPSYRYNPNTGQCRSIF